MAVHHITRWRPVHELLGPTSTQSPFQFTDVIDCGRSGEKASIRAASRE